MDDQETGDALYVPETFRHCAQPTSHGANHENPAPWQDYETVFTNAKAGMDGVDKEHVQKIVYEMSKDSAHFRNEQRKQAAVETRIAALRQRSATLTGPQLEAATRSVDTRIAALEATRDLSRIWIHADMDSFFAAVHEAEQPELKSVPMAVGGLGMISTANYPARKYGVRSAMPGFIAKRLCPQLVFVSPDFPRYTAAAKRVRSVFAQFDPDFESGGLDEAHLDVTEYCLRTGCSGQQAAAELRRRVVEHCGLTCSCGVAPNKLLAKICSDINKPNGQYELPSNREAILTFLETLPTRKIPCIGKVTECQLRGVLGAVTCGALRGPQRGRLALLFPPAAADFFLRAALGLGPTRHSAKPDTSVEPGRKGISCERTFRNMSNPRQLEDMAAQLVESLAADLAAEDLEGRTLTLKLKLATFEVRTRAVTLPRHVRSPAQLLPPLLRLLRAEMPLTLRLMGVRMSGLRKINAAVSSPLARMLGLQTADRNTHHPGASPTDQARPQESPQPQPHEGLQSRRAPQPPQLHAPRPGLPAVSDSGGHRSWWGSPAPLPSSAGVGIEQAAASRVCRTTEPEEEGGAVPLPALQPPLPPQYFREGYVGGGSSAMGAWEVGPQGGADRCRPTYGGMDRDGDGLTHSAWADGEYGEHEYGGYEGLLEFEDGDLCGEEDAEEEAEVALVMDEVEMEAGGRVEDSTVASDGRARYDVADATTQMGQRGALHAQKKLHRQQQQQQLSEVRPTKRCCGENGPAAVELRSHQEHDGSADEGGDADAGGITSPYVGTDTVPHVGSESDDDEVLAVWEVAAKPESGPEEVKQGHAAEGGIRKQHAGHRDPATVRPTPAVGGPTLEASYSATDAAAAGQAHRSAWWTCQLCTYARNRRQLLRCEVCDSLRGTCTLPSPAPAPLAPVTAATGRVATVGAAAPTSSSYSRHGQGQRQGKGQGHNQPQPQQQQRKGGLGTLQQLWAASSCSAASGLLSRVTPQARDQKEQEHGFNPKKLVQKAQRGAGESDDGRGSDIGTCGTANMQRCAECGTVVGVGSWQEHRDWRHCGCPGRAAVSGWD